MADKIKGHLLVRFSGSHKSLYRQFFVIALLINGVLFSGCVNYDTDNTSTSKTDSLRKSDSLAIADTLNKTDGLNNPYSMISRIFEQFMVIRDSMIATPEKNQELTIPTSQIGAIRKTPKKGDVRFHKVTIFYGTDRAQNSDTKRSIMNFYGKMRNFSGQYEIGVVDVNVPVDPHIKEISLPKNWLYTYGPPIKKGTVQYLEIQPLDYKTLCRRIKDSVVASDDKDEFVFIHGYNNSFGEAVQAIAKLTVDLGFNGAPILFTWPSSGNATASLLGTAKGLAHYMADEDAVKWAVPHLKDFIKNVVLKTGATRVHIIAHSMGNRIATDVISSLAKEYPKKYFDQIILAAADVDSSTFQRDASLLIPHTASRVTVYASSGDNAVRISHTIHDDSRVGYFTSQTKYIFMSNRFESIDASNVPNGILGHAYFAETPPLLIDIHALLKNNLSPSQRNLDSSLSPIGKYYWIFKEKKQKLTSKKQKQSQANHAVHGGRRRYE